MILNNIKIALRIIRKQKLFSMINILGLAVGMACVMLFYLSRMYEHSYDRSYSVGKNTYRIDGYLNRLGQDIHWSEMVGALAASVQDAVPEIRSVTRFYLSRKSIIKSGDSWFTEDELYLADQQILNVLSLPLVKGDVGTALKNPESIILSESKAEKYFPGENPVGKTLRMGIWLPWDEYRDFDFIVAGVLKDLPPNTTYHFDFLGSIEMLKHVFEDDRANSWSFPHFTTLALLHSNADLNETANKIQAVIKNNSKGLIFTIKLTHLTDIHFIDNPAINKHLFIFGTATLIILLLACINSMNLSTARSITRTGEVGIKKVVGAHRRQLITQFLSESLLISFFSLGIAFLIIQMVLPFFILLVGRELLIEHLGHLKLGAGLLAITLVAAILSGAYPALVFSGLSPLELFKRKHLTKTSRSFLRKALVMIQFAVLVVMISGTLFISKQLRFVKTTNLGYDPKDIAVFRLGYDPRLQEFDDVISDKILRGPGILSAAHSSFIPPNFGSYIEISKGANSNQDRIRSKYMWVDENFLDTYGISLAEGRNFLKGSKADEEEAVLINEKAAEQLDIKFASGEQINIMFSNSIEQRTVIGVMKDFHTGTLHGGIEPLIFSLLPHSSFYYSVKIHPSRVSEALDHIQGVWQEFLPDRPLEYFPLEEEMAKAYETENRLGLLSSVFSAIAIIISCLGLYGLAVFSAEQRKKEMGVRRILGASIKDLIAIMLKEFASPVVLAMAIAFPVAYWIMQNWLKNFAYRIDMTLWPILISGFLALGIALLTVSHQAIRAATANPVDSLRYE